MSSARRFEAIGRSPMDNLHLFELINAPPGLGPFHVLLVSILARWSIELVPLAMGIAWLRGDHATRGDLLLLLLAAAVALGIAQVVSHLWPEPRPSALDLGTQYLDEDDSGLPSDHVVILWSLALAAFVTRRVALWGFPLLALGLAVGWSRVYLGAQFPFDIAAALPIAAAGALVAAALRAPLLPAFDRLLTLYDRIADLLRAKLHLTRKI